MKRACALAMLALAQASGAAEPVDVKGVPMGAPEAEVQRAHPGAVCRAPSNPLAGDRICLIAKTTYAGAPAQVIYWLIADRVENVTVEFPAREIEAVMGALAERHGKPDPNATGATPGLPAWDLVDEQLVVRFIRLAQDRARVSLTSFAYLREFTRRQAADKKKRTSDL